MKEFDKDGDGQLSDAERELAMATMRERFGGGQGRPPGRGPAGRPGVDRNEMMKKYDLNKEAYR